MTWDVSSPTGSQPVSVVDDYIRELKTDIQAALRAQQADGAEASFPGPNSSAPEYHYRGGIGATTVRPAAGHSGLFFDQTRQVLQRDNGTTWDDIGTNIPTGTVMPFYQASAPLGWTKLTTVNDMALRVVSGSGGVTGGSLPLSGGVTHSHTVTSHVHTIPQASIAHKHETAIIYNDDAAFTRSWGIDKNFGKGDFTTDGNGRSITLEGFASEATIATGEYTRTSDIIQYAGGTTGNASPTTDSQSPVIAYADVILASKS